MKHKTMGAVAFLGLFLVGIRLALPEIVKWRANKVFASLEDYEGRINGVHLALWRGAAVFKDFEIRHKQGDMTLTIPEIKWGIVWSHLFKRALVTDIQVVSPRARILLNKPVEATQEVKEKTKDAHQEVVHKTGKSLPDLLAGLIPFQIREFELTEGNVRIQQKGQDVNALQEKDKDLPEKSPKAHAPEQEMEVLLSHLYIQVRNLTNEARLSGSSYATGSVRTQIMKSGNLSLDLKLDPTAKNPAFSLKMTLTQINLVELNPILRWQWNVDAKKGTFALFMESEAKEGGFQGYIKPFIKDPEMHDREQDKDKKLGSRIKEAIVNVAAGILKNNQSKSVASRIPFEGRFENPEVGIWEAVLTILRNAFIEALKPSLEGKIK
jgi:hypothetical protein